jgi:MFS family permease
LVVFAKSTASASPSQSHIGVCLPGNAGYLTGMQSVAVSSRAVALLCAAQFVVVLDATIVAVALPAIGSDLDISGPSLAWVVSGYTLVFGGFLMLMGRAADLLGRRRVLLAGFALFGGASLACGLAASAAVLIAARVVQGLGAAAVSPAALALLTETAPEGPARTRALGFWTAAAAGGGALGWVLGGLIAAGPGWPWVFLVNVAPCALAIALGLRLLPAGGDRVSRGPLDVAGAFAATGGLGLLMFGLTRAEQASPAAPTAWGSLAAAAALLAAFAAIERRAGDPLLPPGTLREPRLAGGLLASTAITTASTGPLFACLLWLQGAGGLGPAETGLLYAPFNVAVIAGSAAGARVTARRGARAGVTAGLLALGAGAAGLIAMPGLAAAAALPAFALMGLGVGCGAVAATEAGTAAAGEERAGLASGLLNTAAQLGNAIGVSAFVVLAAAVPGSPAAGFRVACVAGALAAVAGTLAFRALHRRG